MKYLADKSVNWNLARKNPLAPPCTIFSVLYFVVQNGAAPQVICLYGTTARHSFFCKRIQSRSVPVYFHTSSLVNLAASSEYGYRFLNGLYIGDLAMLTSSGTPDLLTTGTESV
jgi:hypothetical protein